MIRPTRDHLLLRLVTQPGKVGEIWMPDTGTQSTSTSCVCEVLAVGPGWMDKKFQRHPCTAKVGDKVVVKAYGSHPSCEQEVEHEGETLYIERERDIVGILP
jgi:co-chaperonin GroES (HSP10)